MGSESVVHEPPHWAEAIRLRRSQLRRSQEEIAARSGDSIHQVKVSRVERGLIHPVKGLSLEELWGLIQALDWDVREFSKATGLEVPGLAEFEVLRRETMPVRRYAIPIVDAGAGLPHWNDKDEIIVLDLPDLRGKEERELFSIRVRGNSMSPTYLNGDVVVFWTEGEVQPGKIVAVHVYGDGLIVKRFAYVDGEPLLLSDNPLHEPIRMSNQDRVMGVALGMWRPAK